ncbi:ShlB/FhaC/HecB family hemolysin secretion/activation protein [Sphingomonas tabacisoli]|uniref:ShlB/FhaC/HecB family hemolysin secretion/activation protein n=1 Tax=Sphingomonas tabacisoli TaxID=2249466 RepID=A0ABW4I2U5_9SPHN
MSRPRPLAAMLSLLLAGTAFPSVAQQAPAQPLEAESTATVTLGDVAVTAINAPASDKGMPHARHAAVAAPGQTVQLQFAEGEAFDAAFVRNQFARNGLIGKPVAVATLIDIVQLINAALIRDGYVNTGVVVEEQPPLTDGGTLKLKLVYGRLGSADGTKPPVKVEWGQGGRRGLSSSFIASRAAAAQQGPVDAIAVERDFRLLSDDPAIRTVRADLKALETAGEAQLVLTVDPAPRYDLYVTVANNRSPSVGGERAAIGGSMRNLLASTDVVAFEVGRTSGATDATASYSTPLFDYDLRLNVRGGYNDAAVIDPQLLALDISARDRFVEAGLGYTLLRRPLLPVEGGGWRSARALSVGLNFVHRRTTTFLFGEPFSFTPGSVRGRAEYSALRGLVDFVDRSPTQALTVSLAGTLGLDGTRTDVPGLLQPPQNFKLITAQLNYARRLSASRLELRARLSGQWTDDILYTAERFSVGGSASVRGYRENLILADRGVVGSIELAQPFSLSGRNADASGIDLGAFVASAFVDGAYVDNIGPADPSPRWIAGAGASLAWIPSEAFSARITYAKSLKDAPIVGRRDLQDRGFQFLVTVHPLVLFGYR